MRTIEEIRARYEAKKDGDILGFETQDIAIYLPECIREGASAAPLPTNDEIERTLKDYLPFAMGKAADHRGISAGRSVAHLASWAWLLGRDDLLAFAEDKGNYPNYGVPILKRFAQAFGVPLTGELLAWQDGMPCSPDCESGCDR